MASTSNKPQDSHDSGPKETPNRKDAADRDILPGEGEVVNDTGYQSPEPVAEAEGDPDSIAAYKKVQEDEKAAAEAKEAE